MNYLKSAFLVILATFLFQGCAKSPSQGDEKASSAFSKDAAASKVYVAPGEKDKYYGFFSGGFSGQMSVYGLPSGRLFKIIPVFSVNAENGYGFAEELKPMLNTSHGFIPWDDAHHPELSQTNGETDGRWIFINANNTPRVARIDLETFETAEILEIPNNAGAHSAPFITENTEYVIAGTRFSVPIPQEDVKLDDGSKFRGSLSFISVNQESGDMDLSFQILVPGYDYDLGHCGKGPSHGWAFFTTYNTEQATTMKEIESSQNDKDYIAAINWKKAEEYLADGRFTEMPAEYYNNIMDESTQTVISEKKDMVRVLIPEECPGLIYYLPTPKSPHGVDVDPSGKYIVAGGKLSANIPVHSFDKMLKAIEDKAFEKEVEGIPVLKYEAVVAGEVEKPGLGPLHTEFDGKGYAYTSMFISSEIVKWKIGTWEVVDRIPTYYSIGHLMIPGGDSRNPDGEYVVALNKITKDRYLPTGPELCHTAQLIDISGEKMRMLLDFPTVGEPHYAQGILASKVAPHSKKVFRLDENKHPHFTPNEKQTRVEKNGKEVHVYATSIRSHFSPDNIEGINVGDKVYFHLTNLEQDWDVPHGFAVMGARNAELLVMPGQTRTYVWEPRKPGVYPFYCTDFCSALHQEMQGYIRVSPEGENVPVSWRLGADQPI